MRSMFLAERRGFNAFVLSLAVLTAGYAYAVSSPSGMAQQAMLSAASVSISAGVAPNPDNTLAAQFAAKEAELAGREALLAAREAENASFMRDRAGMISLAASVMLFVLVAVNFYFDRRRWVFTRRVGAAAGGQFSVDLR